MTWTKVGGASGNSGLKLGPEQNTFTGADLAAAEAARDSYFASNPSILAAYDSNPNNLIRLVYEDTTTFEGRQGGAWIDYTPVLQGTPGEVASLVDVPVGQLPYKREDGTFGGSRMRVLDDGSLLAPPNFGVESGSVKFGDVLTLSEAAGFLAISNHLNGKNYTLLDYATPRNGASSVPSQFRLIEAEHAFNAQPIDTTTLTANPLIAQYTVQNTARNNALTFRAGAAMTNVRIAIRKVSNGVVVKYIPSKEAWETGAGGLSWSAGDNTFDFDDTPIIFNTGDVISFEVRATSVSLKGNATVPYIVSTQQLGEFHDVVMDDVYTATDVRNKLSGLTGTNRLDITAIKNAVTSVAGRTGDVLLVAGDVGGLATVATTGAYSDLSGKPTIPTNTNQLTNGANFITAAQAPVQSVQGRTGAVVLTATDVGLGNADNTSDVNKPVSTAQQTAIDAKMAQHNSAVDPHPQYTTADEAAAAAPVQSVNGNTGSVVLTSGNITESGNLYYTDARVLAYVTGQGGFNVKSASSIGTGAAVYSGNVSGDLRFRSIIGTGAATVTQNANDITISVPAATVASVNGQTGTVVLTTTNINEGTNLYYTDTRVTTYLANTGYNVKSVASSGAGSSVFNSNSSGAVTLRSIIATGVATITQNTNDLTINVPAAPVSSVNGQTGAVILNTSNIAESTNLYYTDARVGSYLSTNSYNVKLVASVGAGASVYQGNVGGGVNLRSIIGTGVASVTQNTNDITINVPAPVYPVTSVNGQTGAVVLSTTNVAEGTNLYYTDTRADARVANYITANGYTVKSVASIGTGASVFNSTVAGATTLRAINGTGLVTVTQNASDITVAVPTLTAGTYTPTLTAVTNIQASTAYLCHWTRIDGIVSVSGKVDIDPTASASTKIDISLPVASNLAVQHDLCGNASCPDVAGQSAAIYANFTNDRASLEYVAASSQNKSMYFNFTYRVL